MCHSDVFWNDPINNGRWNCISLLLVKYYMKNNIVLILLLLVIPLCSYSQKSVSTIEKEATNWAIQFEKMNPYQQREASNKLVKFLNSVDSQTKGIWLATLKKNDEKTHAKKLEAKKEADRKAAELLELSRQKERAKILYERSEYAKISKTISQEFDEWLIKDEFEKTTDYTIRLQNTQEVFDSIAYENILVELGKHVGTERMVTPMLGYETEIKPTYSSVKGPRNTNLEFKNYDADRELYVLKIKIKEFEFEHEFNIPIEDAKRLMKEITYYDDSNSGYSGFVNKWRECTIVYPNELDQWIMYEHNFYPKKITLTFKDSLKTQHIIGIPFPDSKSIVISSKDMMLKNYSGPVLEFNIEQ